LHGADFFLSAEDAVVRWGLTLKKYPYGTDPRLTKSNTTD